MVGVCPEGARIGGATRVPQERSCLSHVRDNFVRGRDEP